MKTEDIKLFHKVAEFGSLTETAKWLDLPKSNISRRIKQLESDIQIKLFHRHSRHITLTAAGTEFYNSTISLINNLDKTINNLQRPEKELNGRLKIMISPVMMNIGKLVLEFMQLHPAINVEIISSNDELDLIKNEIDVAFRVVNAPTEENLIAHKIREEPYGLYASPQYLSEHGTPDSLEQLLGHNFIAYRFSNGELLNKLSLDSGQSIQLSSNLTVNSVPLLVESAIQGHGLILLSQRVGNLFAQKNLLEQVIHSYSPNYNFGWIVHPPRQYLSLLTQEFLNFVLLRIKRLGYDDKDAMNVFRLAFPSLTS
ncbi:LysR family transcriptional regulator [Photobacterium gaetbulicola]|uniref:Putative LysR family transcriptional regulator n=1 Tax=Photobacterium gaetbulicola Gung47 TaxID=658445 RepID=A0A0C5WR56_9GAMM|nr:LysR family transcriptional regulator [Photobacterium gaetbulicola]AJR08797.1 putative LysR family transcriptional regulator [Photobacterium gaetbulicola Gung47]PSU10427.1 LysR family transcriptional regulator [Photobacterium gaetbulicola]